MDVVGGSPIVSYGGEYDYNAGACDYSGGYFGTADPPSTGISSNPMEWPVVLQIVVIYLILAYLEILVPEDLNVFISKPVATTSSTSSTSSPFKGGRKRGNSPRYYGGIIM